MSHRDPDAVIAPNGLPLSSERQASGVVDVRSFELGWIDVCLPPAVLIAYDIEAFEATAFARLGMDMPASIERSVKKRQAEFFMGRLAARDALRALSAANAGAASAAKGARDQLDQQEHIPIGASREPVWPDGVVGSITHAGRYAAAVAISSGSITGIGIDIEQRIGPATRRSVEYTVLKPAEQSLLHAMTSHLPYDMLLTIAFSAKESFFKGSFATVGTYFDFDAVELTALDPIGGTLELVLTRSLAPALPQDRRFTLRNRFVDADTVLTSFMW